MNITSGKPSDSLVGLELQDGWKVEEIINKTPQQTGGAFSSGYLVANVDGRRAYLKAIDFSSALQDPDFMKALETLTKTYNFEKNLLYKCKNKRLSKVVLPISDGFVEVPGFPQFINKVSYIIFELASSDIRKALNEFAAFDIAFCLRSLHNVAVCLEQLHKIGIAHQDLKPSNVLVFESNESKVSDLGRSSDKEVPFDFDNARIPGDLNYAPFEQLYGYHFSNDFNEKYAADLYHLGSLFFFFFTTTSAKQASIACLLKNVGKSFQMSEFLKDIPIIENAYANALMDLKNTIEKYTQKHVNHIISMVKQLCEPNPQKRGHPKNISMGLNQFSLERYLSKLDLLAKKAEMGIL